MIKKDIVIIGGGIAGLYTAYKLSSLGYQVAVVQNEPELAVGPSVRNSGWLHYGTFHSALIDDDKNALEIAARCQYGYEQIRNFAPEAIETDGTPIFAIVKDESLADRAVKRWNKGNIFYQEVSHTLFEQYIPGIERNYAKHIFKTKDLPVNYRILYQKLLFQSEKNNVSFFLNSKLTAIEPNTIVITTNGTKKTKIIASKFIFTTGYKTKELVDTFFPGKIEVKIWKSHALSVPRLRKYGFFFIDQNEVSVEPQGKYSIICQSQEDSQVDAADFTIVAEKTEDIFNQLVKVMPDAEKIGKKYMAHACLKPSILFNNDVKRSVNAEIHTLTHEHIIALPGKATEVPFLTDNLIKKVFENLYDTRIALRPGDTL